MIVLLQTSDDYEWSAWKVHINMAMKMKWLVQRKDKSYILGPYLRYEVPLVTSPQGKYYKDVQNTEFGNHDVWKIEESHLRLSLCFQWRFINLNVAFQKVVGEPSRTFLVYSDLVDSNIVGGQQHALVREVEYRRQGHGVAYYEPLHIQWLPCRREYKDVVEVEVAESHGGCGGPPRERSVRHQGFSPDRWWARPVFNNSATLDSMTESGRGGCPYSLKGP